MPLGPGSDVLEDFRSAEDTSECKTGGTSLNTRRMKGGGGKGLGGKKCCRSVLLICVVEEAFSSIGKQSGALPAAMFVASQTDQASTLARNCHQWTLMVDWIALKYVFQATRAWAEEACSFLMRHVKWWWMHHNWVCSGVHHGSEYTDGHLAGVLGVMRCVSLARLSSNQRSMVCGVGRPGGAASVISASSCER